MSVPTVRVEVHAKPGSKRAGVGGARRDALVVSVTQRPVDGAANEAIRRALAEALGVRRSEVSLRSGASARTKLFDVSVESDDAAEDLRRRVAELKDG